MEDNQLRLRDREDKTRESLLSWLSMTDPSINHVAQRRKHQPETGEWLIQGPDFEEWKSSPNSFLWMYGTCRFLVKLARKKSLTHLTAGCGKTVLRWVWLISSRHPCTLLYNIVISLAQYCLSQAFFVHEATSNLLQSLPYISTRNVIV